MKKRGTFAMRTLISLRMKNWIFCEAYRGFKWVGNRQVRKGVAA